MTNNENQNKAQETLEREMPKAPQLSDQELEGISGGTSASILSFDFDF